MKYPKLIDAIIRARAGENCDWVITSDNKDYSNDKVYYVCRWLNHSFRPFTQAQQSLFECVRKKYYSIH